MRIVMMGTGTFAEPTFQALMAEFGPAVVGLVTQPEREQGNKRASTRQTGQGMATIAQAAGLPIAQPESINSPAGLAQLRAWQPDLLVVAAYGQILSPEVLRIPTQGTINVHASLLPKYRGAAPVAYAILQGERQTGVTIIQVTPGLDSGDMLAQEAIDIHPDDTTGSLEARLAQLGARLAVDVVRRYAAGGPVVGIPQDPTQATKAPKIKKEFGLIPWHQSAVYLERFVRAMQPWPTAYTFLHRPGKEPLRLILTKTAVVPRPADCPATAVPGTPWVVSSPSPGLVVTTGDNQALLVHELQPAGKKRMTAEEFLRGYPVLSGSRFGPDVLT
ncbi:MAG: methionyl-tRNA formyltransferase [Gemmataceae bacterium]|nr:methionyl-tRNA formyltransferase [Gemmata sp.]MDW8197286.1 methionyl-tRNA formyltransferase [Gemmataceae bacterium]